MCIPIYTCATGRTGRTKVAVSSGKSREVVWLGLRLHDQLDAGAGLERLGEVDLLAVGFERWLRLPGLGSPLNAPGKLSEAEMVFARNAASVVTVSRSVSCATACGFQKATAAVKASAVETL